MTDRESHELAAKAAGYTLTWKECYCKGGKVEAPFIVGSDSTDPWRPKEDDGDAFRLARDLKMTVEFDTNSVGASKSSWMWFWWGDDQKYATDKEAIFAAAVAIGDQMK